MYNFYTKNKYFKINLYTFYYIICNNKEQICDND